MPITPVTPTAPTPNPYAAAPTATPATPYPNPYGVTPAPNAPNPYAPTTPQNNQLNFGSELSQEVLGGPAKQQTYTNATTTKAPYAPVIGPLNQYIAGTQALYSGGAPQISPAEQAGYTALNAAAGPSAPAQTGLTTAAGENANIAGGSLLNIDSNPYLRSVMKTTGSDALQAVNSTFGQAGRTGSGLNQWDAAQGVARAENELGYNTYGTNIGATMNAINQAPNLVTGSLTTPEALISAGTAETMRPYMLNQAYGGILAQLAQLGGTTNTTQQTESTGLAQTGGILGNILNSLANMGGNAAGMGG